MLLDLLGLPRPTVASVLPVGRARFIKAPTSHRVAPDVERSRYFYPSVESVRTSGSLTFANSVAWMKAEGLFPLGFKLQQYSVDTPALRQEAREVSNIVMGVDGNMVCGLVRTPKVVNVGLFPSSPTMRYLDQLLDKQEELGQTAPITLYVSSHPLGVAYTFSDGVLSSVSDMGEASRMWGERKFTFIFESVSRSPLGATLT